MKLFIATVSGGDYEDHWAYMAGIFDDVEKAKATALKWGKLEDSGSSDGITCTVSEVILNNEGGSTRLWECHNFTDTAQLTDPSSGAWEWKPVEPQPSSTLESPPLWSGCQ